MLKMDQGGDPRSLEDGPPSPCVNISSKAEKAGKVLLDEYSFFRTFISPLGVFFPGVMRKMKMNKRQVSIPIMMRAQSFSGSLLLCYIFYSHAFFSF